MDIRYLKRRLGLKIAHLHVGSRTSLLACTLIALLLELGCINRKQVAALVGVAPYAFESDTLNGQALDLGWSYECAPGALHGGDERQQLES
jgi:hypothetical protein